MSFRRSHTMRQWRRGGAMLPRARCDSCIAHSTVMARRRRGNSFETERAKDDDAWLVISAGALVGDGYSYPHLFPVAAWCVHGLCQHAWDAAVARLHALDAAVLRGVGEGGGAGDCGGIPRAADSQHSAVADRRADVVCECRQRRAVERALDADQDGGGWV